MGDVNLLRDLELLAVLRANQQEDAGAWRNRDRDEAVRSVATCHVPGCDNPLPPPPKRGGIRYVCDECRAAHFIAKPCNRCGGRATRVDAMNKNFPGVCIKCRRGIRTVDSQDKAQREAAAKARAVEAAARRLAARGIHMEAA